MRQYEFIGGTNIIKVDDMEFHVSPDCLVHMCHLYRCYQHKEAENARLRGIESDAKELLRMTLNYVTDVDLCKTIDEFVNGVPGGIKIRKAKPLAVSERELHISPELIMPRDETKKSAFIGPSGAKMAWNEALAGPEKGSKAGNE